MDNYLGIVALVLYVCGLVIYIRYEAKHSEKQETVQNDVIASPLDINDENATVACLIAAIECRNEYKKNVKIVSVKEIN